MALLVCTHTSGSYKGEKLLSSSKKHLWYRQAMDQTRCFSCKAFCLRNPYGFPLLLNGFAFDKFICSFVLLWVDDYSL